MLYVFRGAYNDTITHNSHDTVEAEVAHSASKIQQNHYFQSAGRCQTGLSTSLAGSFLENRIKNHYLHSARLAPKFTISVQLYQFR